jgi:hypothetical protein
MKATYIFCSLLLLCCLNFTGCGQEQRIAPQPDFINLVPSDSIPFAQLSPENQQKVTLYRQAIGVIDIRVISNPFPDPVSLFEIRQLRCNMSESRVFFANRTRVNYDYSSSRPDILWAGDLVNTGVNTGNTSDNYIRIYAEALPNGQYAFSYATLYVSSIERYEIVLGRFGKWLLIRSNPSLIPVPNDAPPLRNP